MKTKAGTVIIIILNDFFYFIFFAIHFLILALLHFT
jgi:hypothetical protein